MEAFKKANVIEQVAHKGAENEVQTIGNGRKGLQQQNPTKFQPRKKGLRSGRQRQKTN